MELATMATTKLETHKNQLIADAEAIYRVAEEDGRELTRDESMQIDTLLEQVDTLDALAKRTGELVQEQTAPADAKPHNPFQGPPNVDGLTAQEQQGAVSDGVATWLAAHLVADGERQRYLGIANQRMDLGSGAAPDGGPLVPAPVRAELLSLVQEFGVCRRLCRQIPMTSQTLSIPKLTTETTVAVTAENTTVTPSDPALDSVVITAATLAGRTIYSNQLAEDSVVPIGNALATIFARTIARAEDNHLFETDAGLWAESLRTTTDITEISHAAALADIDVFAQAIRSLQQVSAQLAENAVWCMSPLAWQTVQQLRTENYSTQSSGQPYMVVSDLIAGVPARLLGKTVTVTNAIADDPDGSADDDSDIYLIAPGAIAQGTRREVTVFSDPYSLSADLQTQIIVSERTGLALAFPEAVVAIRAVDLS